MARVHSTPQRPSSLRALLYVHFDVKSSLIICAVSNGMNDLARLKVLVDLGADVNHQDPNGYTPLHIAGAKLNLQAVSQSARTSRARRGH
eukprot:6486309-Pyramimonas_sp.AAC.1